jgi:UDP-N-acetylglucosamine/UDP-N-acetylgalactosamine 4-epimerase
MGSEGLSRIVQQSESLDPERIVREGSRMQKDSELLAAYNSTAVLVTGGAGFIGSHLVEALVAAGARVRVLDDLSTGNQQNLAGCLDRIEFVKGDIRDAELCTRAARSMNLIFHLAAFVAVPESLRDPDRTYAINLLGTSHIFEAAHDASVARVVYSSSCAVYGDCSTMPLDESHHGHLLSPYAISKRSGELCAEYAYAQRGVTSVGLRYFNVYGARQRADGGYAAVIPKFVASCRAGVAPRVHGDGEQTRDFVHVSDVVRANLLAGMQPGMTAEVINIGTGVATSVQSLAQEACQLVNPQLHPTNIEERPGDIPRSVCDPRRAEQLLKWRARTQLSQGLSLLVQAAS